MIFRGTNLNYADNSGVKEMRCVRLLGGSNRKVANLGGMIKVVARKLRSKKKVSLKKMYLGLIVGVKKKNC